MALDKSVVKRIAAQSNRYLIEDDVFHDFCNRFAQAIYALGVKDEREQLLELLHILRNGLIEANLYLAFDNPQVEEALAKTAYLDKTE